MCAAIFGYIYKHKVDKIKHKEYEVKNILNDVYGGLIIGEEKSGNQFSAPLSDRTVILKVRKTAFQGNKDERDFTFRESVKLLNLKNTVLIIMNTNNGQVQCNIGFHRRMGENIDSKILPLIDLSRKYGMKIIYMSGSERISSTIKPNNDELVLSHETDEFPQLIEYIMDNNISTILYAGYILNKNMLVKEAGIINMQKLGYDVILIRDCTISFETRDTLSGEWTKKVVVSLIEYLWGSSTTLNDLQNALYTERMAGKVRNFFILLWYDTKHIFRHMNYRIKTRKIPFVN